MQRSVVGFHGTLRRYAEEMARLEFDPKRGKRTGRWLGSGLYFFQDGYEAASHYAMTRQIKSGEEGAVLQAEIDLTACLDLTKTYWQNAVQTAHLGLRRDGLIGNGVGPTQKPLEIYKGQVRAGFWGEWEDYGNNELDYFVVEETVKFAHGKLGLQLDTVRGVFLEGRELFDSSWLYDGAHIAIAVRNPPTRLSKLEVIPLR